MHAADGLAGQRNLSLSIPAMAESTLGLIHALRFPRKPDVLGWVTSWGREASGRGPQ